MKGYKFSKHILEAAMNIKKKEEEYLNVLWNSCKTKKEYQAKLKQLQRG